MQKSNLKPVLFAVFSYLFLSHIFLFWHAKNEALRGLADFSIFYNAARIVHAGVGHHLYNIATQEKVQSALYPKATMRNGLLLYDHPPFEILLFLPLAYFSYPAAYGVWAIINILLLFLSYRLLSPYVSELKAVWAPLPFFIFFGFFPAFVAVLQGQDSILLLFVFALAYVNLKQGHDRRGGFFLAISLFKFQFILPFLISFIFWRRWRVIWGFMVSVVMLFLLSLPLTGLRGTLAYIPFLIHLVQGRASNGVQHELGFLPNTMPNIRGIVYAWGPHLSQLSYQKPAIILFSLLAVLWAVWKWPLNRVLTEKEFDMGFSLAMIVSVLTSYHLQVHDMSLLLIPFVLALTHSLKNPSETRLMPFLLYGLIAVFFLSPLYLLLIRYQHLYLFFWPILCLGAMLSFQLPSQDKKKNQASRGSAVGSALNMT